jgi:hypothetical protein
MNGCYLSFLLTGGLAKIDAEILACIVSFTEGLKEGLCKFDDFIGFAVFSAFVDSTGSV